MKTRIDIEIRNNLRDMLKSLDKSNRDLAVNILDNADFSDSETCSNIANLIGDDNVPLGFDLPYDDIESIKFYSYHC